MAGLGGVDPEWGINGIIARVPDGRGAEILKRSGLPVINVSAIEVPEVDFPRVASDAEAAARMAVEYFLARGYRSFAYVSSVRANYVERQRRAFADALSKVGLGCSQFFMEQRGGRDGGQLARWVERLPKPVALFTWSAGSEMIESCVAAGWAVPEDIAVLSGSDDDLLCEVCDVPVSAVRQPTEQIGARAMRLLGDWVERGVKPSGAEWMAPLELVARRSTDTLAVDDAVVARACRYLRENHASEIGVGEAAAAAGVSRRVLERKFAAALGRSPGAYLRAERLQAARRLLAATSMAINEVGDACGFSSPEYLVQAFRAAEGVTPSQYRKRLTQVGGLAEGEAE